MESPRAAGPVSLIVTVRNDREGLRELLDALTEQTEMPDEIVIVDGGSQDGTLEALERWDERLARLRVVVAPGANIAAGRNIAVREARHDWLACTDAGCRPVPGWLAALRRVQGHADIGAGTFVVEGDSEFDRALACTHYPVLEELHTTSRLVRLSHRLFARDFRALHAGGRSMAFSRAAWEAAGGFPEHVYAGEDLAFSATAVGLGFRAVLVEEAVARWRPRATWLENVHMFATYARGDIRTKGRARHLARLVAWTAGPSLVLRGGRLGRLLVGLVTGAYVWLPLRRARRRGLPPRSWWRIPALVALKDVSQLFGAAVGVTDAARGIPQPAPGRDTIGRAPSGNVDPPTVAGFGEEWTAFDQSRLPKKDLEQQFEQYFRVFPWDELPPDPVGFDLGCGSGRWAQCVAPRVRALHCIDASPAAIGVARANLAAHPNCVFHVASVDNLPLASDSMDFGYCLGVLHHVPDTEGGIRACVEKLRPNAPFLIYLYYALDQRPRWFRALWKVADAIRLLVSPLPHWPKLWLTSMIAVVVYFPLARLARILQRLGVDANGLPLWVYRDRSLYTMRTDAYDRFGTRLEKRFTTSQIQGMLEAAGLERVTFSPEVPYWCAVGFKRSDASSPETSGVDHGRQPVRH